LTVAAEIAREAEGRTLLFGDPVRGLVEALSERVLVWAVAPDGVGRATGGPGASDPAGDLPWNEAKERSWDTVLFVAAHLPDGVSPRDLPALLAPSGRLLEIVLPSGEGLFRRRVRRPMGLADAGLPAQRVPLSDPEMGLFLFGQRAVFPVPRSPLVHAHSTPDDGGAKETTQVRETSRRSSVTVIIPSAGRSPWLAEAIAGALAQSTPAERILVVSDGGGEPVRSVTGSFGAAVSLLERPHGGQAAALNAALATVETPFVAFLDDDDRFLPRKLELQLQAFARADGAAFSVTDHYVIDQEGRFLERRSAPIVERLHLARLLLSGSHYLGPTAIAATDTLRRLGPEPFDVSLPRAADHALWFELAAAGGVHVLPLALSEIRRHSGNRATLDRTRKARDAAARTIARALDRWTLETFYPEIDEAHDGDERRELRALARLERAGHLVRIGLLHRALEDIERGLEELPHDGRLLHFRAAVLLESGRLADARAAFEAASRAGAPPAEVACGLGTIAWWSDDRNEAKRQFQHALAADPRSLLARYNLCLVEEAPERARLLARDALSILRLSGFLLSPDPPLEGIEADLVRLRREEHGLR